MALIRCDFFSDVLGLSTSMTVILPQATEEQIGMTGRELDGDAPTLYLLHGLSDDDTAWLRRTSIERYVAPLGIAVVMPQVGRSFYTDEEHGGDYWTFLSEELPSVARSFFHLSDRREDTFVAGLSMGGYGAMKWALRQPERFAAAASMSGALDIVGSMARDRTRDRLWSNVFGGRPIADTPDDLLWLLARADVSTLPALAVHCGTGDHVYEMNQTFRDAARERGVPLKVDFGPGEHVWAYWEAKIQEVLDWLPLENRVLGGDSDERGSSTDDVERPAPASTKG